jgi:hypothetical protein
VLTRSVQRLHSLEICNENCLTTGGGFRDSGEPCKVNKLNSLNDNVTLSEELSPTICTNDSSAVVSESVISGYNSGQDNIITRVSRSGRVIRPRERLDL